MIYPNDFINKIVCGGCLEVLKDIPDGSVDLVVTSPPYNKNSANRKVNPAHDTWSKSNISYGDFKDDMPEPLYQENQKKVIAECLRIIKNTGSMFYNHKYRIVNHAVISPEEWLRDFIIRQVIVWDRRNSPVMDTVRFMPTTEQIYWLTKERKTPYFTKEGFNFHDVWQIMPETGNKHPAPYPVQLAERCIVAACPEGGIVLDPYSGSGTTARAAKNLGRKYIGIELNPDFCKMAEDRLRQEVLF